MTNFRCKLTNGFLVIRPGESAHATTSPSGTHWRLVNETKHPVRLRLGTRFGVGLNEWKVKQADGDAVITWDHLLPADALHRDS